MHALYEQGASLQDIGDEFGITRERVRQLFNNAGLKTRSTMEAGMLKRETGRERVEEILESFYRLKDMRLVALELEIARRTVRSVLRERLSSGEYRTIAHKPAKKTYSDEELLEFLRDASAGRGKALSTVSYNALARDRLTANGRRWPTSVTYFNRFGSWRAALIAAGLDSNPPSPMAGRRRFDQHQCADALRGLHSSLGRVPTAAEYDRYAHDSEGVLPSLATVRTRCGTWNEALRMAGL